ncbi:hypothetical protein BCON_0143g00230 [Botryotinia convoluta]|uniref:Uncharacterized protein n=1 Tax=Botryotinia convoluta TaxID=54673 RepID=A0A4Z1HTU2_9HELO|nr:hypothetical protein BCON_0143g00230 [Botryotinia convoluta]
MAHQSRASLAASSLDIDHTTKLILEINFLDPWNIKSSRPGIFKVKNIAYRLSFSPALTIDVCRIAIDDAGDHEPTVEES